MVLAACIQNISLLRGLEPWEKISYTHTHTRTYAHTHAHALHYNIDKIDVVEEDYTNEGDKQVKLEVIVEVVVEVGDEFLVESRV